MSAAFIGRTPELDEVRSLLDALGSTGRAVVVSGPPGIGKTSFLDEVEVLAGERAMQVLAITGSESEVSVPYAALHLLVQGHLTELRETHPEAAGVLERCVVDAGRSGLGAIGMALVHLLEQLATQAPVLVRVDDAHWLDQPSFDTLVFAARRLVDSPVACVFCIRDSSPRRELALRAGCVDLRIPALTDEQARELVTRTGSWLGQRDRRVVLEQASGNPLAIVELPRAILRAAGSPVETSRWMPLTERLEDAFASRHAALPETSRDLLLVAASSDRDDLDEVLRATARLPGWDGASPAPALEVARDAGLVEVREGRVVFEHPLVRSAIYQRAGVAERQAAHGALASVLPHEPTRQLWHRAAAATELDDQMVDALVEAAGGLRAAGDDATAFAALHHATRTARDPARRAALAVDVASQALDLGRADLVHEILPTIDSELLDELDRNRLAWLRELTRDGTYSGGTRVMAMASIARRISEAGDSERALEAIYRHSMRMWFANPTLEERMAVTEAAESMVTDPENSVRLLSIRAFVAPMERAAAVADQLERLRPAELEGDSLAVLDVGMAAISVGDYPTGLPQLLSAAQDFRRQGRLGLLAQALSSAAWTDVHLGRFLRAQASAEESIQLAHELGQPLWEVNSQLALAAVLARRGDIGAAEAIIAPAERVLQERGAAPLFAVAQVARATVCMTAGRHGEAVDQLGRLFDPADECFHLYYRSKVAADLIEAASRAGRLDEIAEQLATLEDYRERTGSKILTAGLVYGAPFRDPDRAEEHYERAIDELRAWPFLLARSQLGYGMWLRRHRRLAEARHRLRIAVQSLPSLGALALTERAREELRAAGESKVPVHGASWESLTAHELQICQLAAQGLSNREIGDRLLISHRTVSTHLYKIYPKLGISGRGQLAAALTGIDLG